jgi:anthranilate phosphoribosyltransferase
VEEIAGGTPEENAARAREVLEGAKGPHRDVSVLNAGAAVYVGGLADDLAQGIAKAEAALDSGAAREVLERLVKQTAASNDVI